MYQVLLIKPSSKASNALPPIGLGYLATELRKAGYKPSIINCIKDNVSIPDVLDIISSQGIDMVGVSCCSNEHPWLEDFAAELKKVSKIPLVAGGPHSTGMSGRLMKLIPRVDFVVRSEGEIPLVRLVDFLRSEYTDKTRDEGLGQISNLVWRDSVGVMHENPIVLPPDLDQIGPPAWDLLKPDEYTRFAPHGGLAKVFPVTQIITTRGCPHACYYCAASILNGRKIRTRSAGSVVDEIEYLINHHGIKEIHFEDDNFTYKKDHAISICREIRRRGIRINFGLPNGVRVDRLDDEILTELEATGFYFFSIGIESGSPETLKRMNKKITIDKIIAGVKLIRKYKFRLKGFFILGYPGETRADIEQTIEFAKALDIDQAFFSIYIPLPGTVEFANLESRGEIRFEDCNWDDYFTGKLTMPPYTPDGISKQELKDYTKEAFRAFYFRPKQFIKMLMNLTSRSSIIYVLRRAMNLMTPK